MFSNYFIISLLTKDHFLDFTLLNPKSPDAFKGIVHPKMKILSSFRPSQNWYEWITLKNVGNH